MRSEGRWNRHVDGQIGQSKRNVIQPYISQLHSLRVAKVIASFYCRISQYYDKKYGDFDWRCNKSEYTRSTLTLHFALPLLNEGTVYIF